MRLIIGITGASGVIYGQRLLEVCNDNKIETFLIVSDSAKKVASYELKKFDFSSSSSMIFQHTDLSAPIASGSFKVDGMVIIPASMKTIGALASGYCDDLISRSADVQLKEGRKVIVVPRETPLHLIHLENMARLSRAGVIILPAMPAFYHEPKTVDDMINFVVGKVLDQFHISHNLFKSWGS